MSEERGKLIVGAFPTPRLPGEEVEAKIEERGFCMHRVFWLDDVARTVQCGECKSMMDPFTVLCDYAKGERLWKHYHNESIKAANRLHEIEKQEREAKARTRNANRKDAEHAVAEEKRRQADKMRSSIYRARQIADMAQTIVRHLSSGEPMALPSHEDTAHE